MERYDCWLWNDGNWMCLSWIITNWKGFIIFCCLFCHYYYFFPFRIFQWCTVNYWQCRQSQSIVKMHLLYVTNEGDAICPLLGSMRSFFLQNHNRNHSFSPNSSRKYNRTFSIVALNEWVLCVELYMEKIRYAQRAKQRRITKVDYEEKYCISLVEGLDIFG